jgi:hypothetical protein
MEELQGWLRFFKQVADRLWTAFLFLLLILWAYVSLWLLYWQFKYGGYAQ